jgi:hypothetical protein
MAILSKQDDFRRRKAIAFREYLAVRSRIYKAKKTVLYVVVRKCFK